MTTATLAPHIAPVVPAAPRRLPAWQRRAIVHSGELAIAHGLPLLARGDCPGPVWAVTSASRPGQLAHLVWLDGSRICCDCEQRQRGEFTCSHAQFVRRLLVAELAEPRSVPPAAARAATTPASSTPEPEPPSPDGGPTPAVSAVSAVSADEQRARMACPTCAALSDPDEIKQLGECLRCLEVHAEMHAEEAQSLPCWACGALATQETDHGLYCDACVVKPAAQLRREVRARHAAEVKEQTARRIAARDEEKRGHATTAPTRRARATRTHASA